MAPRFVFGGPGSLISQNCTVVVCGFIMSFVSFITETVEIFEIYDNKKVYFVHKNVLIVCARDGSV